MAYYHATPAGAGLLDGSDWANAFGIAELQTFLNTGGGMVAGDIVYIAGGTYTATANIQMNYLDATGANPIGLIGVKSGTTNTGANVVESDYSTESADRPYFDMGSYLFETGRYYDLRYLHVENDYASTITTDLDCRIYKCTINNDGAVSGGKSALSTAGNCSIIANEITCPLGNGISGNYRNLIAHNYIHNCNGNGIGVYPGTESTVMHNIIADCSGEAIITLGADNLRIINNIIYDVEIAVLGNGTESSEFINNIIDGCTVAGFSWNVQNDNNIFIGNHGDDARNTDMWVNVAESGSWQHCCTTTGDPLFTDPANGDFSLQANSPCRGTAQNIAYGVGSPVEHGNKGAWQGRTNETTPRRTRYHNPSLSPLTCRGIS